MFLEECEYIDKEKMIAKCITHDQQISSDDSDESDEE